MQRIIIAAVLLAAGTARADAPVEVTKSRLPSRILVDVAVTGGPRELAGEHASGLALGAELGRRLHPHWGVVAVLEADAMARDSYISYGAWTVGAGVRIDARAIVTLGAGLAMGSSKQLVDYMVIDGSTSGVAAFAHGLVPLTTIGRAHVGLEGNIAVKAMSDAMILSISAGAGVAW